MASKVLGGRNLAEIANRAKERSATPVAEARPFMTARVPAAELALTGRVAPTVAREPVFAVDPKRCRPWRFHNRLASWYTAEACADVIESMRRDGQQQPALARKLTGDPNFDYELIYGMRRRFAAEQLGQRLTLRLTEVDDATAAVLMHVENADRQDITAMERALSFQAQLDGKLFATQDALAAAMGLSKGQVAKMLKATQLLKHAPIAALLADRAAIPVKQAYALAVLMDKSGAKELVLNAAVRLGKRDERRPPAAVLKALSAGLDSSRRAEPLRRDYNIGATGRMIVARNARGKVTLTLPQGLKGGDRDALVAAIEQVLKDLG